MRAFDAGGGVGGGALDAAPLRHRETGAIDHAKVLVTIGSPDFPGGFKDAATVF